VNVSGSNPGFQTLADIAAKEPTHRAVLGMPFTHFFIWAYAFTTLGVEPPAQGITWKANFGRNHAMHREVIDRAIWSSSLTSTSMDDTSLMGEIVFE
jgi:hypothetical protein